METHHRRPSAREFEDKPVTLAQVVGILASAGMWSAVHRLLGRLGTTQRPYFLDEAIVGTVESWVHAFTPQEEPFRDAVLQMVRVPEPAVLARYIDDFARHATSEQVEQLLADIVDAGYCVDKVMSRLLDATLAKMTARSVRTLVEWDGGGDTSALVTLLTRRPDMDPNTLLADGKPAWYVMGLWPALFAEDKLPSTIPRVDINTPYFENGVTAPLLEHQLRLLGRRYKITDPEFRLLLLNGAHPLHHAVAAAEPFASMVQNLLFAQIGDEADAEHFQDDAQTLARAGLFPRPEDVAALTAILGADSPALARLLAAFGEPMRWHRRADVLEALYDMTQLPREKGDVPPRRAQRARLALPADPANVLRRVFEHGRRAKPVKKGEPYGIGSEHGEMVAGFFGGRQRR